MSYKMSLGNIAERYDELTGSKTVYSLEMYDRSGECAEYVIAKEINGTKTEVFSLFENEAHILADLIKNS